MFLRKIVLPFCQIMLRFFMNESVNSAPKIVLRFSQLHQTTISPILSHFHNSIIYLTTLNNITLANMLIHSSFWVIFFLPSMQYSNSIENSIVGGMVDLPLPCLGTIQGWLSSSDEPKLAHLMILYLDPKVDPYLWKDKKAFQDSKRCLGGFPSPSLYLSPLKIVLS